MNGLSPHQVVELLAKWKARADDIERTARRKPPNHFEHKLGVARSRDYRQCASDLEIATRSQPDG